MHPVPCPLATLPLVTLPLPLGYRPLSARPLVAMPPVTMHPVRALFITVPLAPGMPCPCPYSRGRGRGVLACTPAQLEVAPQGRPAHQGLRHGAYIQRGYTGGVHVAARHAAVKSCVCVTGIARPGGGWPSGAGGRVPDRGGAGRCAADGRVGRARGASGRRVAGAVLAGPGPHVLPHHRTYSKHLYYFIFNIFNYFRMSIHVIMIFCFQVLASSAHQNLKNEYIFSYKKMQMGLF